MKAIFVDTFYWIALLNSKDTWPSQVIAVSQTISNSPLVVSDGIIDELFAYSSKRGDLLRLKVSEIYKSFLTDPNIQIVYSRLHGFFCKRYQQKILIWDK